MFVHIKIEYAGVIDCAGYNAGNVIRVGPIGNGSHSTELVSGTSRNQPIGGREAEFPREMTTTV